MDTQETGRPEVPSFIYGTAWKEERTAELVAQALEAGFRAIDTANQRKHYHEAGVGEALRRAFDEGHVSRDDLFLQTKYTYERGQDHRLPYDPAAPIAEQVQQSFERSLTHLGVRTIDSLVLHGPTNDMGLVDTDFEAWRAMEAIQKSDGTRLLGISNVAADQLEALLAAADVPPTFVQNRCFAVDGWDAHVRSLCASHGVVYQGFSLLTANRKALAHPDVTRIARECRRTVPQLIFRFAMSLGILPLTGTSSPLHMREDLAAKELTLDDEQIEALWLATIAQE